MEVGGENRGDEQDSVGEAIMRSVSRRLARCTKLGSCRREPLNQWQDEALSHYSATTVCLSPCFTVVHFTELAGTLHFDYVSARQ